MEIWITTLILLLTLIFLVTEKISVDLTGIGIIVFLVITGILTPRESIIGFSNPAVITVGAMFVISQGMMRTGAVEFIGRRIIQVARGRLSVALAVILFTVAVASAFINNTPVVVLFIPVVMAMCCEFGLSPSKFLIPISYASILAGTCTLIGTSTNIIISDLSALSGQGALGMFELSRLGIPIALVGMLMLFFISPHIMPDSLNPICQLKDDENRKYLTEIKIPPNSDLIGRPVSRLFNGRYADLEMLELIRYSHIYHLPRNEVTVAGGDRVLVKGDVNDLVEVLNHEDVVLPNSETGLSFGVGKEEPVVVELIVTPGSIMVGDRIEETDILQDPQVNFIAVKRSNLHFNERQVHDVRLKNGDILLVWCYASKLAALRNSKEYIIIEDVYEEIVLKRKSWISLLIFVSMVVTATLGVADILVCALAAAFLMIVTGCLQMRDAYRALQGDVLLLIAGTIALGVAMEKTGTSVLYARAFLDLFHGYSPGIILGGIIVLTSICTQILSNNATAVLLFPIAVSAAQGLGVDPKPFIIGVCFGASACFASPVGYQTNLLVYGPGGYRFSDFLKLGIPLNLLVIVASTIFIPLIWPF